MSGQDAGFPPGISAGGLGRRVLAYVVDALPAAVLAGLGSGIGLAVGRTDLLVTLSIVGAVLALGWWVLIWWLQGSRGASLGQRVASLELVAVENGRPIGFGRAALRGIIFLALAATSVGAIVMLVMLLLDSRRQGWHDRASRSVVITARASAQQPAAASPQPYAGALSAAPASAPPVGLPPGLGGQRPDGGTPAPYQQAGTPYGAPTPGPFAPTSGPPPMPGRQPSAGEPPYGGHGAGSAPPSAYPHHQPTPGQPAPGQATPAPAAPDQVAPGLLSRVPDFGGAGAPAAEEVSESTRLVPRGGGQARRPDQGWKVVLPDGREVAVETLVLVGRNPQPRAGEEGAELVKVSDSSRTVSKTHIAIGVDQRGAYVMDRGSTNGSAIATSSGAFEPCAPGQMVRVRENQVVSFGEQRFEVRRSYAPSDGSR